MNNCAELEIGHNKWIAEIQIMEWRQRLSSITTSRGVWCGLSHIEDSYLPVRCKSKS
jgi:hypothetical protein